MAFPDRRAAMVYPDNAACLDHPDRWARPVRMVTRASPANTAKKDSKEEKETL